MATEPGKAKTAGDDEVTVVDDEVKAKATGKRKTKLVKIGQYYIDLLLEERALNPVRSFPSRKPEDIASYYKDQPEKRDEILSMHAKYAAVVKKRKERDDEILRQYHAQGFAYLEISDDEN